VPVMPRGDDLEALLHGTQVFAAQAAADQFDDRIGKVREVGEGFIVDLRALPIATPQQVGLVDLAVVVSSSSDDMHRRAASCHARLIPESAR